MQQQRHWAGGYLIAAAATAGATLLRWAMDPLLGDMAQFVTFLAAIVLAGAIGGRGPALAATVLSAVTVTIVFVIPAHPHFLPTPAASAIAVAMFVLTAGFISWIAGRMHAELAQRRRAEQVLQTRMAAIDAAVEMILITDPAGTIQYVNPAFTSVTGYSRQEVIGQTPRLLKSGLQDEQFYRDLWQTILSGRTWRGELMNRRKDGTVYPEEMTITPVIGADGKLLNFIAIKRDITERKSAEEALMAARISSERAKETAEAANAAKDHFLAVLSHELRTPLTPVLAAISIMERRAMQGGLDEEMREDVAMMRRNVEQEARLVDDLLDVSRIARGKVELDRKPMDLGTAIRRAVETCMPDIEARALHLSVDFGPDAPYIIEADFSRLQQVFWNLLRNALKFTPQGGRVDIRCYRSNQATRRPGDAGAVVVEVSDNGEGMEPEAIPRLFAPFEQAERAIAKRFGGLGLGLSICKALVELHGGTITGHSAGKGTGATFAVALPMAHAPGLVQEPTPADSPHAATPRSLRILLVEDHGDTMRMMRHLLNGNGHEVRSAADVASALVLARQWEFDLLISDLGLPDRTGLDLMRELKIERPGLPAIALSGYGQEQDVRHSHEAGFAEHLTKPINLDQLNGAIARVMGGRAMVCGPTQG